MKTYEVLGSRDVLGHSPGDTFTQDVPAAQERRLVGRGQLRVVENSAAPEAVQPEEEAPDDNVPEEDSVDDTDEPRSTRWGS